MELGKYKTFQGTDAEVLFKMPDDIKNINHPYYGWMILPNGDKVVGIWDENGISNYCWGVMAKENQRYNLKLPILPSREICEPAFPGNDLNEVIMSNDNKGIGDYIILAILGSIWSFDKFGFDWYGLKAILSVNGIILMYAVIVHIIASIRK